MHLYTILFLLLMSCLTALAQPADGQKNGSKKEKKVQQEKKSIGAVALPENPKIDGAGDDDVWQNLPIAWSGNFTQISPHNLEPAANTTDIKIGYTDYALYVLALMHDPAPKSVARELGLRDDFGSVADRFGIVIDTYNQGQNAFYFAVTSAGVQLDLYITPNNEDVSWDAVWNSAVQQTAEGWVAELEIPWSAIRFAKRPEQQWGVNFMRIVRSRNEESFWSPVDASEAGLVNQSGILHGINNIEPPLRLQVFPYVSAVAGYDRGSGSRSANFGGGMDVKWGISESFTLDMALIPDFSQVQSDNQVLNLSPYEVQYDENRPFFTEGTELFNKGGLFYSRRVGQTFNTFDPPVAETSLELGRPANAKLINATKISGRTHKGLGVGVFNAVTNETYLQLQDTVHLHDGSYQLHRKKLLMDPVTNFNIVVVDQNLPYNSNISLLNTNVTRQKGGRDANVTATDFRFRNKKNMYEIEGFGAYSNVWANEDENTGERQRIEGYRYSVSAGKISGNFQFRLTRNVESDRYDINDLGMIQAPNEVSHYLWLGYQVFEPVWIINQGGLNVNLNYERLYKPSAFTSAGGNVNGWVQFKNFWDLSFGQSHTPIESHDYFETRRDGYYFTRLPSHHEYVYVSTDRRKRLAAAVELWRFTRKAWDAREWGIWFEPRYRLNNNVSLIAGLNYSRAKNERGYVTTLEEEDGALQAIIFGDRNLLTLEPSLRLNVTFNNKMGLNVRARYYWSRVRYNGEFFQLQPDGSTVPAGYGNDGMQEDISDPDVNFNSFNIDLFYSWQIAPGSFLTFGWKDASQDWQQGFSPGFSDNIDHFLKKPHTQTFSLKLTYFVDYLLVKNWLN
ncbi:membrane associated hydrolase [Flammeovirgaceae bacterium 311]|nr:membrane associated hydrolase [Flammeovirgaceae bacterium 311]